MKRNRWLCILVLTGCGQLGGCIFMTNRELRIVDVDAPKVIKAGASDGWSMPPWSNHSTQVAISFSTSVDLWDFAKVREYNVSTEVAACIDQRPNSAKQLQSGVYLYTKSGPLNSLASTAPTDMGRYRIYFNLTPFPATSETAETFRYDLASKPQDVCFKIRGGNMLGGAFYSNTVVVPGTAIRKALSEATP